ncbi:MAG: hypothetical protein FLDDKLPJ_02263 [Phycisphaerae bacterium]|nr:hypothetical protein [Phycisphaerae bacterium]
MKSSGMKITRTVEPSGAVHNTDCSAATSLTREPIRPRGPGDPRSVSGDEPAAASSMLGS